MANGPKKAHLKSDRIGSHDESTKLGYTKWHFFEGSSAKAAEAYKRRNKFFEARLTGTCNFCKSKAIYTWEGAEACSKHRDKIKVRKSGGALCQPQK